MSSNLSIQMVVDWLDYELILWLADLCIRRGLIVGRL